ERPRTGIDRASPGRLEDRSFAVAFVFVGSHGIDGLRAVSEHILMLPDEGDLCFLDVLFGTPPEALANTKDAAEDLRDPLNHEQNGRDHKNGFELVDRHAGRAEDADLTLLD